MELDSGSVEEKAQVLFGDIRIVQPVVALDSGAQQQTDVGRQDDGFSGVRAGETLENEQIGR